jgi:TolA-binding protein
MMNMSIRQEIQRQIVEIETRISQDKGDVEELKKLLTRLRMQDFEEDIRETDNRQFLRD